MGYCLVFRFWLFPNSEKSLGTIGIPHTLIYPIKIFYKNIRLIQINAVTLRYE